MKIRTGVLLCLLSVLAAPAAASEWPQFQRDVSNSGVTSDPGPISDLDQLWRTTIYDAGSTYDLGRRFAAGTSPALHDGAIYAYALGDAEWAYDEEWDYWYSTGADASLVALDAADGTLRWKTDLAKEGGYDSRNGVSVDTATGDVYVASWHTLYRLSAVDGSIVWRHTTPGSGGANAVVNGAPTIAGGRAYWLTQGGDGHLVGVDLDAGTGGANVPASMNVALPSVVGGSSFAAPVVFEDGGTAQVALGYGYAYMMPKGGGIMVLDANSGDLRWHMSQAGLPASATDEEKSAYNLPGSVTCAGGVIYARSYDLGVGHTQNGTLWAIDAAGGQVIWRTQDLDPDPNVYDNCPVGHGAPIVAEGKVFVAGGGTAWGATGMKVQAYDADTGVRLWSVDGIGGWANQIAYANGYLYVGSEDYDVLTVLDANSGSVADAYPGAGSSPIVADGVVYTIDDEGAMVAITGTGSLLPVTLGDVNGDGGVDNLDVTPFIAALNAGSEAAFQALYPDGRYWAAECMADGNVDNLDITPFIGVVTGGGALVPEPASILLIALGAAAALARRR